MSAEEDKDALSLYRVKVQCELKKDMETGLPLKPGEVLTASRPVYVSAMGYAEAELKTEAKYSVMMKDVQGGEENVAKVRVVSIELVTAPFLP